MSSTNRTESVAYAAECGLDGPRGFACFKLFECSNCLSSLFQRELQIPQTIEDGATHGVVGRVKQVEEWLKHVSISE
jgi:hypothetical protein